VDGDGCRGCVRLVCGCGDFGKCYFGKENVILDMAPLVCGREDMAPDEIFVGVIRGWSIPREGGLVVRF
jgi:hypothetical protein